MLIQTDLGAFTTTGNVVKPSDLETLGIFQGLQRVLNFAHPGREVLDEPELKVDGEIGLTTLNRARVINQLMAEDPASVGVERAAPIGELSPFLGTPQSLANSAAFVIAVMTSRLGIAPDNSPKPSQAAVPAKPAPALPPALRINAKRGVGVGTIVLVGLLGLALLGTIVYVVRR